MIIDAFTYAGELQTLKMRLELHDPFVDEFWIAEGDRTFSGKEKPWTLADAGCQLKPWLSKIKYVPVSVGERDFRKAESLDFGNPAWSVEHAQRNALKECVDLAPDDAIVVLGDLDEFVDFGADLRIQTVARLQMLNHYYYMNCRGIGENKFWYSPLVLRAGWLRRQDDVSGFRTFGQAAELIEHAGWHFSYLGGAEAISKKISAFSHTELDRAELNNLEHLTKSMERGEDWIGRKGHEFAFYPLASYPSVLQNLMRKNENFVRWTLG